MSWLGQIRPHRRDEAWSASLWQTFFATSVRAHIPLLAEGPLSACESLGVRPPLHMYRPLGCQEAHDWAADQIADLFRTTHKVKTQQVSKSRRQRCGDIELAAYLANAAGPVPLVLDLRIAHERVGNSSDPSIKGHLRYPNDLDRPLNEAAADTPIPRRL
jgi:hypothetical protein